MQKKRMLRILFFVEGAISAPIVGEGLDPPFAMGGKR